MIPTAQFEHQLPLLFADDHAVAQALADNRLLQDRYHYDPKTQHFRCRSKKKFHFYAENSPEKDFYALLHPHLPKQNLAQCLSESDLVKYYLIYCWAADFAHQHKLDATWEASFQAEMQQKILQKSKQHIETVILSHQTKWSAPKNKLYSFLMKQVSKTSSLPQRVHAYKALADQAQQKHFYHDQTKSHVFNRHTEAVARYEYELLMHELSMAVQPILYYPKTVQQQDNLCEYGRHCFFRDKDTKELKYINSWGTIFTLPSTTLLAKNTNQIKANGSKWVLEYQDPRSQNKVAHCLVDKMHSTDFGTAFRLDSEMVHSLVPKGLPEDPIIELAKKTLKSTKQYYQALQYGISLFTPDHILAFQHRMAGLIQIKEMLQNKPTREIRQTKDRPIMSDFMGPGRNTYVFFEDPLDPEHTELWHVDRSENTPVLTQFPMQDEQADKIRYLFDGARSIEPPMLEDDDDHKWYQLGQHVQRKRIIDADYAMLRLDPDAAKHIPQLALSDMDIYQHLTDDWIYYETSNRLIDLLENTEKTPENKHMIQRCYTIHQQLNLIEKDRLHAFPESRGVVPPEKRQEIMQMMIALVKDKNSPEARHYFRDRHRIYHAVLQEDQLDEYEPSSFIWDEQDTLYYLDDKKNKVVVPMTDSIRRKLQSIADQTDLNEQSISANDVYELMTRPRLFYYYRSIPVWLDFRWLDFTYYVPLKFDRSKGLHTGTAQELLRGIHEYKLSISALLFKLGEMLMMVVIPLILAAHGIDFPYEEVLGKLGATIVAWVFLVWDIEFTYHYLKYTLLMNDLVHPELNQLDKMLQDLNNDVSKLSSLEQGLLYEDGSSEMHEDLPLASDYLSYLRPSF